MAEAENLIELLFFDTFSHDINEDLNLDLVQFPQPVYITEIRIIPLGARVQADFPGGVRLGATNPSKFHIELFVNDLAKPGASAFERLGDFEYNQNDCINFECPADTLKEHIRQIPTDGLVLRGWYTTITLAVYGSLAKDGIGERPPSSPPTPVIQMPVPATAIPINASSHVPSESTELNPKQTPTEVDWANDDSEPKTFEGYQKDGAAHYASKNLFVRGEESLRQPSNESDTKQSFTESWSSPVTAHRAKSSDADMWDCNDSNTSKTASCIASPPRSSRRSRSPAEHASRRSSTKRDWSKSPEYRHSRRRSYDHGVLDKKLMKPREYDVGSHRSPQARPPRTPSPESTPPPISTRRPPRTPEQRPSDDFNNHKVQSPQSTSDDAPAGNTSANLLAEEDTMSQGEPFEPILSDEEMNDDSIDQYELDYEDDDDISIDFHLKQFNPFTEELAAYVPSSDVSENLKELISLATKCLNRTKIKDIECTAKSFLDFQTSEMRENWVHATEQLIQIFNLILNSSGLTAVKGRSILKTIIEVNMTKLIDWVKIGLDFKCANSHQQPGYKIRHVKCGVRLVEMLASDENFTHYLITVEHFNIFDSLFDLYEQRYMALSIKLVIFKAISACLDTKFGVEYFTSENSLVATRLNGYQLLINAVQCNPLTRIKFAIKSILKKINLYESLQSIRDIVTRNFVSETRENDSASYSDNQFLLRKCLEEVYAAYTWDAQSYSQPKRFLPVAAKFDHSTDSAATKHTINSFISYFRAHAFLESILLIVSNRNKPIIGDEVFDITLNIIEALCGSDAGLEYLNANIETTNVLAKCLLQVQQRETVENDVASDGPSNEYENIPDDDSKMHNLGLELSYKMRTKYCLDAIADIGVAAENREAILFDLFQPLYNMAMFNTPSIRNHITNTIGMGSHIITIIKIIEIEKKAIASAPLPENTTNVNGTASSKENKSPILCYAIDLLDQTIRNVSTKLQYLQNHGQVIANLVKMYDQFEPELANILQDLNAFIKPLEISAPFSYDNITPLCEIVRRNVEFITTYPGELITALRIIRFLAIPESLGDTSPEDEINATSNAQHRFVFESDQRRVELKHKFVVLQFYSAEGITMCTSILDKLTTYFAQPAVHVATLSSAQGAAAVSIILPTVELLRRMISYVIEARNTEYKDLSAIEPLLKTFTLMSHIPPHSLIASEANTIQNEVIRTLMAYTQPMLVDCVDTESIHKSLWTQMIAELCKNTLTGPYTFMASMMVFINLLPVPLPIPTNRPLSQNEVSRLVTHRQLWSAHLHPNSLLIGELIQALCVSSYTPLLDTLSRLIIQLADLAPNMGVVCIKAIVDVLPIDSPIYLENTSGDNSEASVTVTLSQTKRVLGFLCSILSYSCAKVAFLSILPGKVFDFLIKYVVLRPTSTDTTILSIIHQTQEHILNIFHTLLNADINMIGVNNTSMTSEVRIACALPTKDNLTSMAAVTLDFFLAMDGEEAFAPITCQFAALKALLMLTDHDFTSYHLRNLMEKQKEKVFQKLKKMVAPKREEDSELVAMFLLYLHAFARKDVMKTERNSSVSEPDLCNILNYKQSNMTENQTEKRDHPLLQLETFLSGYLSDTETTEDVKAQMEDVMFNLKNLLNLLDENTDGTLNRELMQEATEPPFPQGEGIVHQYSIRPVFALSKYLNGPMNADQLTTTYWCSRTSPLRLDDAELTDTSHDTAPCDLLDMVKTCLPVETNLTSDCKRLLHLSASPQSNRDRTATAPCFRTRRVEVEPMTGRPEKKVYISRGRPYPRTPASRSDLFRSRPPNTSRPPSLHVDDFLALETCGAQPTGPTGYNKLAREIISIRGSRGRGRSGFDRSRLGMSISTSSYRQSLRRNSPSTWSSHEGTSTQHFRTATAEPVISSHFPSDYASKHFSNARSRTRTSRLPRNFNR